jgi:hypothetical protein
MTGAVASIVAVLLLAVSIEVAVGNFCPPDGAPRGTGRGFD